MCQAPFQVFVVSSSQLLSKAGASFVKAKTAQVGARLGFESRFN